MQTQQNASLYLLYNGRYVGWCASAFVLLQAWPQGKLEWGLLTTDLSLSFLEAYRLYARRWTTEVAYKDCKTLLNFGKCQSVHFAAQIASFTLTMMQYNILCPVKRFKAYKTIGGLFAEVTNDSLELSVSDKI